MATRLVEVESLSLPEQRFETLQLTTHRSVEENKKLLISVDPYNSRLNELTASDKTKDLRRSPMSAFVSWPNWTRAPRNLRIFNKRWLSCPDELFANRAETDEGVTVGGGVPLAVGDELLCRFTLELLVFDAGIIVLTGWMWWGDIGDLGAITRAPSGESGVLHCSLPARLIEDKKTIKMTLQKSSEFA